MKKLFTVISAMLIALLMISPVTASSTDNDSTTPVAFPGANMSGFGSAAGLWLDAGHFFAQGFNTNQSFVGFIMTAWATEGSSVDYALYTYHNNVEDTIDYDDLITSGTAVFDTTNPSGFNVLFEEDDPVPAGKYVLVISVSMGRCGLTLQPGNDKTDFLCSEDATCIDNFGMSFDPTNGDSTVMTGGIIFSGSAGSDAFRSITEEGLNPPDDKTTAEPADPTSDSTPDTTSESTSEPTSGQTADPTGTSSGSTAGSAAPSTSSAAPQTSAGQTDSQSDGNESNSIWVIIGIAAAVIIIAVIVVIVIKKKK